MLFWNVFYGKATLCCNMFTTHVLYCLHWTNFLLVVFKDLLACVWQNLVKGLEKSGESEGDSDAVASQVYDNWLGITQKVILLYFIFKLKSIYSIGLLLCPDRIAFGFPFWVKQKENSIVVTSMPLLFNCSLRIFLGAF